MKKFDLKMKNCISFQQTNNNKIALFVLIVDLDSIS